MNKIIDIYIVCTMMVPIYYIYYNFMMHLSRLRYYINFLGKDQISLYFIPHYSGRLGGAQEDRNIHNIIILLLENILSWYGLRMIYRTGRYHNNIIIYNAFTVLRTIYYNNMVDSVYYNVFKREVCDGHTMKMSHFRPTRHSIMMTIYNTPIPPTQPL